jgi:hypothetical protein
LETLVAMGVAPPWTVDMLTEFATQGPGYSRLDAAAALRELTGEMPWTRCGSLPYRTAESW